MVDKRFDTLLWRIEGIDSLPPSYLFGSIHVPVSSIDLNLQGLFHVLQRVDLFFMEVLLDEEAAKAQQKCAFLPLDRNWKILLGKKKFEKIKQSSKRFFQIDIEQYIHLVPLMFQMILTQKLYPDGDWKNTVDCYLYDSAVNFGLEARGLENAQKHFEILGKMNQESELDWLESVLRSPQKFRNQMRNVLHLYNSEKIRQIYLSTKKTLGQNRELMLYGRNRIFVKTLLSTLTQQKTFFATFGAGHLWGKYGVIALLKQHGYHVKPIKL